MAVLDDTAGPLFELLGRRHRQSNGDTKLPPPVRNAAGCPVKDPTTYAVPKERDKRSPEAEA